MMARKSIKTKKLSTTPVQKILWTANIIYENFIEKINCSENAYLFFDATDRPTFQIKDAPLELLAKLKTANLG
jgi:hypothetical protein